LRWRIKGSGRRNKKEKKRRNKVKGKRKENMGINKKGK
jgi:hypothetical protein